MILLLSMEYLKKLLESFLVLVGCNLFVNHGNISLGFLIADLYLSKKDYLGFTYFLQLSVLSDLKISLNIKN